jgi:NAD(P)-dependent dehydrogenase (short-subunit alcohol dehydrogenase family)
MELAQIDVEALVPFHATSDDDMSRVVNVNAHGAFLISKAVARVMSEQEPPTVQTKRFGSRSLSRGAIVHIASAMAFGAVPYKTPYITAKHALLGIVKASGKRAYFHCRLNKTLTLAG